MACPGPKVATRYTSSDWHKNILASVATSQVNLEQSHKLREEGRFLANETEIKTRWDHHDSNVRLAVRIDDLNKWKETVERTLNSVDREIAMLSMAKEQAERALQDKTLPHEVNKCCLIFRDRRLNFEVVKDNVERELYKEAQLIQSIKEMLSHKCNEAFEQLCILQELRNRLDGDLQDKRVALTIDCDQLHLECRSANKSFKPIATRQLKNGVSYDSWLDISKHNVESSESEIRMSQRLRESIYSGILQTDNDLMAQKESSEYEYRKRMHEVQQALDELQWQKKNIEDEIALMEKQIYSLEEALRSKTGPYKVAQTRLENRHYRPNNELCNDDVVAGLAEEVRHLHLTKDTLQEMIDNSRGKLNALEATHHLVTNSLRDKMNALKLDQQCMEERQKLPVTSRKLDDTEKSLHMLGIQRNLPETNWIAAAADPNITSGFWNASNPNVNHMRTAWELGRTDPHLVLRQLGPSDRFGKSGLYANASTEKTPLYS